MTVADDYMRIEYTGNSATTVFPFTYKSQAKYITVSLRDINSGVETLLTSNLYSVASNWPAVGGSVTYPVSGAPLTSGFQVIIERFVPYTQELLISNQIRFFPNLVEEAFDEAVMRDQQLDDRLTNFVSDTLPAVVENAEAAALSAAQAASSASSAASSASSAALSQAAADVARTQAQLAAQAAGAALYASVADGLAATVDSEIFLVQTEPGVQVYQNSAGTDLFLGWLGEVLLDNASAVVAWTPPSYPQTGLIIRTRKEGFSYTVAASGAAGQDLTTAGGVKLDVLRGADGTWNIAAFNPAGDGATDDAAAFVLANARGAVSLQSGVTYAIQTDTTINELHARGGIIRADGARVVIRALGDAGKGQIFEEANGGRVIVVSAAKMDRRMYGAATDKPECPFAWSGTHPLPNVLYVDRDGLAVIEPYSVEDFFPATDATVYTDYDSGDNATGDGTVGNPWQTISFAINEINADGGITAARIVAKSGQTYWRSALVAVDKAIVISTDGAGKAYLINSQNYAGAWSATGGAPNVYQVTDAAHVSLSRVLDRSQTDADGDWAELTLGTSTANVSSNPGSYWIDGNVLYVHAADSRNLTTTGANDILGLLDNPANKLDPGKIVALKNLVVAGYDRPLNIRAASGLIGRAYAVDCEFCFSAGDDAFYSEGGESYFQNSEAYKNLGDGFSYHDGGAGAVSYALEVDCVGRDTGGLGAGAARANTDNGSTGHDGSRVVRIRTAGATMGEYHGNAGPNIIDVTGAWSWNVGVSAYNSRAKSFSGAWDQRVNFKCRDGSIMWIEGGQSVTVTEPASADPNSVGSDSGSVFDFGTANDLSGGQGIIYLRNVLNAERLNGEGGADDIGIF